MKPHEEAWVVTGCQMVTTGTLDDVVCDARTRERQEFIAAAPEMARALVALLEYASQWESWNSGKPAAIATAEDALKKAGVL